MADQLAKAKQNRGTMRTLTTKLLQKIETEMKATKLDRDTLRVFLEQLKSKEEKLTTLNEEIEKLITVEEMDEEVIAAEEYQEKIIFWKTKISLVFQEKERDRRSGSSNPEDATQEITVKLPRLTLQKFDGDSCGWQSFWSQFDTAIHQNTRLSQVDKFNYLKSYLEGAAANAISGLALSNENYEEAIHILAERFGRKDVVINGHMNRLLSLQPVKSCSDICGLRKLYDSCELQIRSLQTLGVVADSYGTLLCPILTKLLPREINIEYSRRRESDSEWDVMGLLSFLKKEIESRERADAWESLEESVHAAPKSEVGAKQNSACAKKGEKPKLASSAAALCASAEIIQCLYCNKADHETKGCTLKSVLEKKEIIKRQGRCFICLKERHKARFCRSRITCEKCRRRHHTSICEEKEKEKTDKTGNDVLTSMSGTTDNNHTVFLQTALVSIKQGENRLIARCLIDGGSQRSFIRQDLSEKLCLDVVGKEQIKLHTFGSDEPENTERRRVKLTLSDVKNPEKGIEIEVLETPKVCGALIQVPNEKLCNIMKAKGLPMADGIDSGQNPVTDLSILIGADFYWQIMTGKIEKLGDSLVAIESLFGWTIHGPTTVIANATITEPIAIMHVMVSEVTIEEETISNRIKAFSELDATTIRGKESVKDGTGKEEIMKHFESNILFEQNKKKVGLPKKQNVELESDSYEVAEKRFQDLEKKFLKDPVYFERYSQVLEERLDQGIIEVVQKEQDQERTPCNTYYLPQAVIRERRQTTTPRTAYDASSHKKGCPSQNDCLDPELNLIADLPCKEQSSFSKAEEEPSVVKKVEKKTIVAMQTTNETLSTLFDIKKELPDAEIYWIKEFQNNAFREEIKELSTDRPVHKESKLSSLSPFLDDSNILRVGVRLQKSNFSYSEEHPAISPREENLTELQIENHHERVVHSGISETLGSVPEENRILQGRREVKRELYKCVICKKFKVKPTAQMTSPLPKDRVLEESAFSITVMDFCVPVYVKKKRKKIKLAISREKSNMRLTYRN